MSDHIKRFNLSASQPGARFNLASDRGPVVRDKDNAQPVIPPPKTTFVPHPRLAPPGMMGSRLAQDAATFMDEKRETDPRRKEFKPFAHKPDKSRGWER